MSKIVFIAPARPIAEAAEKILTEMNVQIPVFVGANEEAVQIVSAHPEADIIISRGGTADDIRRQTPKTVVEITVSVSDLMKPVNRLAKAGHKRIGIVAKYNMMDDACEDLEIGELHVFMRPWREMDELTGIFNEFSALSVFGVVVDKYAAKIAQERGLTSEFLESGPVALKRAIASAITIDNAQEIERARSQERADQLQQIISEIVCTIEKDADVVE